LARNGRGGRGNADDEHAGRHEHRIGDRDRRHAANAADYAEHADDTACEMIIVPARPFGGPVTIASGFFECGDG
jgi:hypothetical protein